MEAPIPPSLMAAYRTCEQQAFGHYENFPVASILLPRETRPHVAALYAFARTADDFADEPPPGLPREGRDPGKIKRWRFQKLDQWERGLRDALQGKKAPPELEAFAQTMRTFQIPPALPRKLLRAFRMDAAFHRFSTWRSLLYYCRHSADPVGRMVLLIHGIREEKFLRLSDFICSGLQLINFWQDTSVDLARGRIYYPGEAVKKAGVTERDLRDLKPTPANRRLVRDAVDFTEVFFRRGYPLLDILSGRLRLEIRATYLGGREVLNKIRAMDYNVLEKRPALDPWNKALLVLRTLAGWVSP